MTCELRQWLRNKENTQWTCGSDRQRWTFALHNTSWWKLSVALKAQPHAALRGCKSFEKAVMKHLPEELCPAVSLLESPCVHPEGAWPPVCDSRPSWLTLLTPECLTRSRPRFPEALNLISRISAVGLFPWLSRSPLCSCCVPPTSPRKPPPLSPPLEGPVEGPGVWGLQLEEIKGGGLVFLALGTLWVSGCSSGPVVWMDEVGGDCHSQWWGLECCSACYFHWNLLLLDLEFQNHLWMTFYDDALPRVSSTFNFQ